MALRWVDPDRQRQRGGPRRALNEPLGVRRVGGEQRDLACGDDLLGPAMVDDLGRQEADPGVACSALYHRKNGWQKERLSSMDPKRLGNSGRYLSG